MGREARINPRSYSGQKDERSVLTARLARVGQFFSNRRDYDAYVESANVTDAERVFLEQLLPERLRQVDVDG